MAPGESRAPTLLLNTWRETVPTRDNLLVARVGEGIIDAYRYLRRGEVAHGTARLALLLGALEQHVLDDNRWAPRAQALLGLPPVPIHMYQKNTPPGKGKLGPLAQLADPVRTTTANGVYKDTHGEE